MSSPKCVQNLSATQLLRVMVIATTLCSLLAARALAADDMTLPLRLSENRHFLTQPDGAPFFWLGENAWELFQRPDIDEINTYIGDRAKKGFNVILAVIGGVHAVPSLYGEMPFVDDDPTRPNDKYFDNVDRIIDVAARHGVRIAIVPAWSAALRTRSSGEKMFNSINAERYGRWIGDRYRTKGVIWILGGDSNPLWPEGDLERKSAIVDYTPIYDAMAKGLVDGSGGYAFITYHPSCCSFPGTARPLTSLYLGQRWWLTINMIQSSHYASPAPNVVPELGFNFGWLGLYDYQPILEEFNSTPWRPVIDGEALFEDLGVDNDIRSNKGFWNGSDARNAAYHAVFAGAAGHTYGNHSVWQFYDPAHNRPDAPARLDLPWQKAMARPVSGEMHYLKDLMLSRPYFSRIPDDLLIVGDVGSGARHVSATRDRAGSYAMIYFPQRQPVTVNLSKLSGSAAAGWWFDPRTGIIRPINRKIPIPSTCVFTPPSDGEPHDWVLVLDDAARGFRPPGSGREMPSPLGSRSRCCIEQSVNGHTKRRDRCLTWNVRR